jgi:hypothetical protein
MLFFSFFKFQSASSSITRAKIHWRGNHPTTVFQTYPGQAAPSRCSGGLSNKIYAMGDSRGINISIEKFLGRPCSLKPFLKRSGVK